MCSPSTLVRIAGRASSLACVLSVYACLLFAAPFLPLDRILFASHVRSCMCSARLYATLCCTMSREGCSPAELVTLHLAVVRRSCTAASECVALYRQTTTLVFWGNRLTYGCPYRLSWASFRLRRKHFSHCVTSTRAAAYLAPGTQPIHTQRYSAIPVRYHSTLTALPASVLCQTDSQQPVSTAKPREMPPAQLS